LTERFIFLTRSIGFDILSYNFVKFSISIFDDENKNDNKLKYEQFDLFNYNEKNLNENVREKEADENKIQKTIIDLKKRYKYL
jgi:hypothetical protein